MAKLKKDGHWQVPSDWPRWNKKCGAKTRQGRVCAQWAIRGMPTCKYHGSGGMKNKDLGMIRYMCWVITGGPQNQPIELACTVALAVFAEAVLKRGQGTVQQQMNAAMWLTTAMQ